MASRYAVVSTKSGYVSKHRSLEVACKRAYTGHPLVPHFVAWWRGRKDWRPFGGKALDVMNEERVTLGREPMTMEDYVALVGRPV